MRILNDGITFSCYRRMRLLSSPDARDVFEYELERVRRWYASYILAYVVMPGHVHLLISEPQGGELSVLIQMLKQIITSRKLRPADIPRFWQVWSYSFPVWSEAKRREKVRYIHRNPVKRGLVTRPEDWPWSSFNASASGIQRRLKFSALEWRL
jgi:putative transposase